VQQLRTWSWGVSPMKRYLINAAQMSVAVTIGILLSPVLLSLNNSALHYFKH
jgi:hypothetical protein